MRIDIMMNNSITYLLAGAPTSLYPSLVKATVDGVVL